MQPLRITARPLRSYFDKPGPCVPPARLNLSFELVVVGHLLGSALVAFSDLSQLSFSPPLSPPSPAHDSALPARTNINDQGRWVNMSSILFGIPGLYRHVVERGQYPISTIFAMRRYTGPLEHITVFHLAQWYAHIGVSLEQATCLVCMARRTRNERDGHMLDDTAPFDGECDEL
ncbi:hypothetical protein NUW54_g6404 [Trametes sanguinea]|uniref:Uncharacterized protein n=1 Tax=Trametes sanguinea TaxID=158606 RepID=A0ACC1PTS7_9APHY|nr:hypothetical protein NUW54_g6404 [Trametes sanguinea]